MKKKPIKPFWIAPDVKARLLKGLEESERIFGKLTMDDILSGEAHRKWEMSKKRKQQGE